jgi:hypothetical protein
VPNQPNLNFRPKPRYARPGRPNFGATARPGRPPYRGRVITDPRLNGVGKPPVYFGDKGISRRKPQKKVGGFEQALRAMLKRR